MRANYAPVCMSVKESGKKSSRLGLGNLNQDGFLDMWLVRIKNTCLTVRSHSSKSDLVSSLGLASKIALRMRSEFRLGLPCRREFARVAAQIFSGTLNSISGIGTLKPRLCSGDAAPQVWASR